MNIIGHMLNIKKTNNLKGVNMKTYNDKQFMLVALKPFKARGLTFKVGDRVSSRMTYLDAIKKAKRENIGHSVGTTKKVAVKPFVQFKSSWERA
ncbi:hypothetical protein [uncultured Mediterranean phage uvMED]|nr:hypothetical protein [uncultured Mediterranean phage uvMED]